MIVNKNLVDESSTARSLLYILCDRPHCGVFYSISVCVGLCIYVPVLLLVFVQHFML